MIFPATPAPLPPPAAAQVEPLRATARQPEAITGLRTHEELGAGSPRFTFSWRPPTGGGVTYHFTLTALDTLINRPAGAYPLIDRPGLTTGEVGPVDLAPGDYIWQVSATWTVGGETRSVTSEAQPLTVGPPAR